MTKVTKLLSHKVLRFLFDKHALKYRAAKEAVQWEREGYNYRDLWRHHSLFIKETNSIYVAISKSANSSVRRALSNCSFKEAFDRKRNKEHGIYQLQHIKKSLSDIVTEQVPCITVVRNPVDRFWSAYQNKIIQHKHYGLAAEVAVFHGRSIQDIDDIPPEMVLDYIEQTPTHLIEEHLRPQWACCGFGRLTFKMIARVESLKKDLQIATDQGWFPQIAVDRIKISNPSDQCINTAVKQSLNSRVQACYAKDYESFEY